MTQGRMPWLARWEHSSSGCSCDFREHLRQSELIAAAGLMAAGLLTHYFFFVLVAALLLLSTLELRQRPRLFRYWSLATLGALVPLGLWLLWFFALPEPSLGIGWIDSPRSPIFRQPRGTCSAVMEASMRRGRRRLAWPRQPRWLRFSASDPAVTRPPRCSPPGCSFRCWRSGPFRSAGRCMSIAISWCRCLWRLRWWVLGLRRRDSG